MADVTISGLSPGTPQRTDVIPFSNGSNTLKVQVQSLPVSWNSLTDKPVIASSIPVGAVFYMATSTRPSDFLICDGTTIPNGSGTIQGVTANFAPLFAVIGSTYGASGRLPDLRGQFIRGFDSGRGLDSGRAFGSNQADQIKAIPSVSLSISYGGSNGYTSTRGYWGPSSSSCYPVGAGGTQSWDSSGGNGPGRAGGFWGINLTGTAGTETRPTNVALLPVIKY